MQVHGDDMLAACSLQHICHELGGDGSPTLILFVLPRIWEIGEDSGDSARGGGSAGIDQDEQLHNMIVDVARLCRLEDEDYSRQSGPRRHRRRFFCVSAAVLAISRC